MKKWWIVSLLVMTVSLPMIGCATFDNNQLWQNNVSQLKSDIHMFAKLATRIALTEANMPTEDTEIIKGYLIALRDLLAIPGEPNFVGARILVSERLPAKYRVYGLTIIDVIERYLQSVDLDITQDQKLVIGLISSGIDGALEAVEEFAL